MEERKGIAHLEGFSGAAVTLGKFDGIHRGHKLLINQVLAEKRNGRPAVLLAFDIGRQTLYTQKERRQKLARMGIDCLVECPLDERLRQMEAEDFIREILVEKLQVKMVAVGEDFRFGFKRLGTPRLLTQMGGAYGFSTKIFPKVADHGREISSTYIRQLLGEGEISRVNELLGDVFYTSGEILHGRGLGHRKLVPTTNLRPPAEKLLPRSGVYVTISDLGGRRFGGVTNVGYKPTVGGEAFAGVETYLFGCRENLYGQEAKVYFLEFLRPEQHFSSLQSLKAQLFADIRRAKAHLADSPAFERSAGQFYEAKEKEMRLSF